MMNFARAGFGVLILTGYCSFFSYTNMAHFSFRWQYSQGQGPLSQA